MVPCLSPLLWEVLNLPSHPLQDVKSSFQPGDTQTPCLGQRVDWIMRVVPLGGTLQGGRGHDAFCTHKCPAGPGPGASPAEKVNARARQGPGFGPACGLAVWPPPAGQGGPGGGVRSGHAGPALRGPLCSAGTAPTTRWCPCSRAAAPCPRWWWRRGSSRSPAVSRPWPWAALAAGAPAWVTRGGIPEPTEASALPADLQLPSPGWAASELPLQPRPHLSPQLGRSPGPSSWANLA